VQEPPHRSNGTLSLTPQSLPISSIMAGNHQVKLVAATTKVPYPSTPHQPRSQTLTLIPVTTLWSAPIMVWKVPAQRKYRSSHLLLLPRPIDKTLPCLPNAEHYPRHRTCLDSALDDVIEQCYDQSTCTDSFNPSNPTCCTWSEKFICSPSIFQRLTDSH
jgi:hypothetical protein